MANRILLADDSITIQKVVNLTFSDEGIDVVTVGNGDLALRKLRDESFDLVLADIFMPGTDGYRLCEYVKSQPELSHVPVILLVGAFEPFDRSEAARVRADGHLTKPFESRILVETVRRMLASVPPRPVAPAAPEPPPPPVATGWDAPPAEEFHFDEGEPAPPSYDPYASTAKLPALHQVLGEQDAAQAPVDNATTVFGSPYSAEEPPQEPQEPAGDLFHLDVSTPFVIGAEPSPIAPSAEPLASFDTHPPFPALPPEPPPTPTVSPIGYQPGRLGDSPLELDDLGTVERHEQVDVDVLEVRDPLLDTFEDVKESTAGVDAAVDPGLVPNAQPEGSANLNVRPVDDLVSGWDQAPQSDASRVPPPPSGPAWEPNRTQAYTLESTPFESAERVAPDAADAPVAFDPNRTQMYSASAPPFEAAQPTVDVQAEDASEVSAGGWDESASTGAPGAPWSEPTAPGDWQPEAAPPPADDSAAYPSFETQENQPVNFDVVEGAPAEGPEPVEAEAEAASAQSLGAIPSDLIDEVVRRTVERMSDDVIREIAWEVVPDLAEALIRKHLAGRA